MRGKARRAATGRDEPRHVAACRDSRKSAVALADASERRLAFVTLDGARSIAKQCAPMRRRAKGSTFFHAQFAGRAIVCRLV
jgi:hypothetical protein